MSEQDRRGAWDEPTATINLKLPGSLKDFMAEYARKQSSTISQLTRDYYEYLRRQEEQRAHTDGL